jgi:hypothetical protein
MQVEYIFSDKTGTLTCNEMELMKCCVDGQVGRPPQHAGAGGDHRMDRHKNWLRFAYDSAFLRSHDLHPHPYRLLLLAHLMIDLGVGGRCAVGRHPHRHTPVVGALAVLSLYQPPLAVATLTAPRSHAGVLQVWGDGKPLSLGCALQAGAAVVGAAPQLPAHPGAVDVIELTTEPVEVSDDWVAVPRELHTLRPNSRAF